MMWAAAWWYIGALILDAGVSGAFMGSGGIVFRFEYRS